MAVEWNAEQKEIFREVKETSDNLMIEALAGAAKTTTIVEASRYLKGTGIAVAFNKKIADELKPKLPSNIEAKTLNALGHRILGQGLGKKLTLSDSKLSTFFTEELDNMGPGEERDHLYETFADTLNYIKGAKNHGHVPDSIAKEIGDKCQPLLTDQDFFELLPEEPTDAQRDIILSVLRKSFNAALAGFIDFSDQLLLPTVVKMSFPMFQNVLVDEAQDLSELNHVMIAKFARRRIIAVGDSLQAIYAFRGAHREGMPRLAERFKMRTLTLSTSFRCPEAVCNHVRGHATRIQHWEGNPNNPGKVSRQQSWDFSDIPDGSVIICRNNAPLFRLAIRLLKVGRRPTVWGRDVAASLIKTMEKLGAGSMRQADALLALLRYQAEKEAKLKKESAKRSLQDRVDCMRVFIMDAESLNGAITLARNIFNSSGTVDMCSGHKSKGHEWEKVFFLDDYLIGDDDQELNLRYVIATRSKRDLTYIDSEGYVDP